MKKLNLRKQYWAYAVLAAVCAGFIYTPQIAEAKFGAGATTSTFDTKDVVTFVGKSWYVVDQSSAGGDNNKITLFCKDVWSTNPSDFVKFNDYVSGTLDVLNDYGSTPYQNGTSRMDTVSKLMRKMQELYEGLAYTTLAEKTAKDAIQAVNLEDVNVTGVRFYAPSKTEVESYISMTLPGDSQFPTDNSVARATVDYWTRSPDTSIDRALYYRAGGLDISYKGATEGEFALRPVIQVDQDAAGSTLVNTDPTKTSGSYFSSKVDLATNGTFVGDTGSGDPQAYTSVADAAPNLDCTYLVLDGTSIKIKNGTPYQGIAKQGTDPVEYSTNIAAILVNEDTLHDGFAMASGSTFSDVSEKIDYIATLAKDADYDTNPQLSGNLTGVAAGTYGLKIFGIDNTNYKATQLGSGVINKLEKTSDGKLNITIGSTTNAGFAITLAGGAGVTLDADASNAITVEGIGSIDLASYILNANINNNNGTLMIKSTGAAGINGIVSGGIITVAGDVTFNKYVSTAAGGSFSVSAGKNVVLDQGISTAFLHVGAGGHVTSNGEIASGLGGVALGSNASLTVSAKNLQADVKGSEGNTDFTVNLTGTGNDNVLQKTITKGVVNIGKSDDTVEMVIATPDKFDNVTKINIGKDADISKSDTLKITDINADTTFATNITGGNLAVAGTAGKVFTLSGTVDVQSISIDTTTLQIPASLLLTGSAGSWNVITGKENFVAFSNNAGLNLDLNGAHYTLSDLNTIEATGSLNNEYVTLVNGILDLTGNEKLSTEADGNGVVSNATVAVHKASDGGKAADKISAAEKYVMVGKSDDKYQTPATLDAVTISQTPGTNNFVAKGLQIIPSGSSATLNVTSNSQVVLAGGTDSNGNISTPLVKAVLDVTDYKSEALDTKVVIDPTSTLQVGVDSGNATTQGMVINELDLGGGGILNVKKTYLKVSNVTSSGGKIVIDPSYTENSDKTILNAETTLVQDGSVLNIGDMSVEKMKTAASEWGKSVMDTLGGGFTMNSGAMVGLGSAVAMPSSGKLWLTNNGSTHSEQVYFGNGSLLAVSLPSGHAESEFNGSTTIPGIISNVASLGSAGGASIYLDGALEESKYYVIVSGDNSTGINPDGTQTVWDADHIYTSDAALELVPVTDPDAMLGIDIGNFKNMIVLKATEGDILMAEPALNPYHPIMEKMVDAPASSDLNKMYADMKNVYRKNHKAGIDAMDSLMGLNSTSSMMRSGIVAANLMSQTTLDHVSLMERSSLNPNYGRSRYADGLRNTVAARDIFEPEYVDVGRSSAVMPVPSRQYTPSKQQNYIAKSYSGKSYSEKSYKAEAPKHYHSSYGSSYNDEDKKVWAEYIHSKETTDGMAVTGNGDNSTSGAVVGFDLWSGDHSFGGVSVAYSQTDVNNSASSTVTKNDIDTYGVGIYTRHDYSHCSMIFDAGYNYSKNDIKQEQNFGHNFEITGKPKVQIYDAGLRYEHSSHVSDKAAFVPYVGVRYTMVDPDSYCTNIGFKYKSKEKDIVSVPLGIRLSFNLYGNGFMVKPYLDFGYQWNFGQKNWKQTVMYDDVMSTLKYDVMDSNSHFINGGLQVYASNFNFGAGYRHSKSNHAKNNKWTINANWDL